MDSWKYFRWADSAPKRPTRWPCPTNTIITALQRALLKSFTNILISGEFNEFSNFFHTKSVNSLRMIQHTLHGAHWKTAGYSVRHQSIYGIPRDHRHSFHHFTAGTWVTHCLTQSLIDQIFQLRFNKAAISHFIQLLPDGMILSFDSFNDTKHTILAPVAVNETIKITAQHDIAELEISTSTSVSGIVAALQDGRLVSSFLKIGPIK